MMMIMLTMMQRSREWERTRDVGYDLLPRLAFPSQQACSQSQLLQLWKGLVRAGHRQQGQHHL